jgi:allophanate hydrolase
MIPGLKVVAPGLRSTIQDLGRRGYRDVGVPLSGPLDRIGLILANGLVGNAANAPALEILVQGPVLEVLAGSLRVALVGGSGGLVIEGEQVSAVAPGQSVRVKRAGRIRTAALGKVFCAYLAVEGGFAIAPCLGSAATYTRNRFGGFEGRALDVGDILPVRSNDVDVRPELALGHAYDPALDQPIRVVLGPQQDYFADAAVHTLLSATYTVSVQADRMGFRLDGPKLAHAKGYDIVSDGTVAGAIQVPGSGQPIVLLADAQTTGGYPKIATVISADVPVIARRRPGASVRFASVTRAEGEAVRREQEKTLGTWLSGLQTVREAPVLDLAALQANNLIDGVANALD